MAQILSDQNTLQIAVKTPKSKSYCLITVKINALSKK